MGRPRAGEPDDALADAFDRHVELLQEVRKGLAAVVTAAGQLESHCARLRAHCDELEHRAREALMNGREDAARRALELRVAALDEAAGLDAQTAQLQSRRDELVERELGLTELMKRLRSERDRLKAAERSQ
jgi:phage shock protein A